MKLDPEILAVNANPRLNRKAIEEEDGHCRLAYAFKKRRGIPGYSTALDENGWLCGTKVGFFYLQYY